VIDQGPERQESHPILLYDGVCGLCNRMVQFVLRRDEGGRFRFAALQSGLAAQILARHGARADDLDTMYVVLNYEMPEERLVARSDAIIFVLRELGGGCCTAGQPEAAVPTRATREFRFWHTIGFFLQLVPRAIRDWGYRLVAGSRYRVFGRHDNCPLPSAETRGRFLD